MIHDDWLFRFGFPGFAETVWVLPRGVRHQEPWYEPLPWGFACHALEEWALADSLADRLRELHRALLGAPLFEPDGVPLHALVSPLRDAFAQGDLVAWALCTHAVQRPAQKPATKPGRGTEPTARPMAFELAVVDEIDTPVPGAALELQTRGGVARITTNGAGVARLEGTTETDATVRITNEDDVRRVLERRWSTVRGKEWVVPESLSPETEVEVRHAEPFPSVRAHAFPLDATVERHTIILEPRVLLASLHGAWFDPHRAFVLPTALDGVAFAVRRAEENPGTDVLIVGHTDPLADAEDGPTLSLDRARAVVALITGDAATWLGFYADSRPDRTRWGRREDELMIEAIARARGELIPFGASILGWYADRTGFAGQPQAMRPRIVEAYMGLIGTRLTRQTVTAHGCAGWFPLDPADLREGRGNARLEMFLFEKPLRAPATESGVLPAPRGDIAPKGSPVRAEWLLRARRRFEHCVGPPPPWKCHVSILARSNSGRVFLADRPFRLHSGDGRMLEGRTDRDGWLHADCVLPRDYLLDVDGVSTSVPAMPLHFGPRETRVPSYFIYTDEDG